MHINSAERIWPAIGLALASLLTACQVKPQEFGVATQAHGGAGVDSEPVDSGSYQSNRSGETGSPDASTPDSGDSGTKEGAKNMSDGIVNDTTFDARAPGESARAALIDANVPSNQQGDSGAGRMTDALDASAANSGEVNAMVEDGAAPIKSALSTDTGSGALADEGQAQPAEDAGVNLNCSVASIELLVNGRV